MIKFVFELLVACIKGDIVELERSNKELGNGKTLAYYNFVLKTKTPTHKKVRVNDLESRQV